MYHITSGFVVIGINRMTNMNYNVKDQADNHAQPVKTLHNTNISTLK